MKLFLDFSRFRRRSFSENWLTYEDVFENPNENHSSYISHYKEYRDGGDKRKNKLVIKKLLILHIMCLYVLFYRLN